MNNAHLAKYFGSGFDNVEGWASPVLFEIFDLLDSLPINREGGCLEIGVHHGKFFLLLNQLIQSDQQSYAIDLFDNQALNIDFSGSGNLQKFKKNLATFDRHKGRNTKLIAGDSLDSRLISEAAIPHGSLRFISVDGGHTKEHTVADLVTASSWIANEGVVILDDILNPHWLGVIEGFFSFMSNSPTLAPFAVGHNKLFLSKLSFHKQYLHSFENSALYQKTTKVCGFEVAAI